MRKWYLFLQHVRKPSLPTEAIHEIHATISSSRGLENKIKGGNSWSLWNTQLVNKVLFHHHKKILDHLPSADFHLKMSQLDTTTNILHIHIMIQKNMRCNFLMTTGSRPSTMSFRFLALRLARCLLPNRSGWTQILGWALPRPKNVSQQWLLLVFLIDKSFVKTVLYPRMILK